MRSNKFITKGIRSFFMALIAPVAFLCLFLYFDGKEWYDNNRNSTLYMLENEAFGALHTKIDILRHQLDKVADGMNKNEDFYRVSAELSGNDKSIDNIFFISSKGKVRSLDKDQKSNLTSWFNNIRAHDDDKEMFKKSVDHGVYYKKVSHSNISDVHKNKLEDVAVLCLTRPLDPKDPSKGLIGLQIETEKLFGIFETSIPDMGIDSFIAYKNEWTSISEKKKRNNLRTKQKDASLRERIETNFDEVNKGLNFNDINANNVEITYGKEELPKIVNERISSGNTAISDTIRYGEYSYKLIPLNIKDYYAVIKYTTVISFSKMLLSRPDFVVIMYLLILIMLGTYVYNFSSILGSIDKFILKVKKFEDSRSLFVGEQFGNLGRYKSLMEMMILLRNYYVRLSIDLTNKNEELLKEIYHLESNHTEIEELVEETEKQNSYYIDKKRGHENLIDNISDIIWCFDESGKIILAGKNFETVLGYEEGQIYNINLSDILCDTKNGKSSDDIIKMMSKRDFDDIEIRLKHKNGKDKIITSTKTIRLKDAVNISSFDSLKSNKSRQNVISRRTETEDRNAILAISRDISRDRQRMINNINKSKELLFTDDINRVMSTDISDMNQILKVMTDRIKGLLNVSFSIINIADGIRLKQEAYAGYNYGFLIDGIADMRNTNIGLSFEENRVLVFNSVDELYYYDKYAVDALNMLDTLVYLPLQNSEGVIGVLTIATNNKVDEDKLETLKFLAHSTSLLIEKVRIFEKQRESYYKTVTALTNAMEQKLFSLRGHAVRVSEISVLIGERMFLRHEAIRDLRIAGLLHDIGKIGIEDKYLISDFDPSISVEMSNEIISKHPELSGRMIEPIGLSHDIYEAVVLHHLRYDLKGYPSPEKYGVEKQPVLAQIIQIADAFENRMSSLMSGAKLWKLEGEVIVTLIDECVQIVIEEFGERVGSEFSPGAFRGLSNVIEKDGIQVLKILGGINADI